MAMIDHLVITAPSLAAGTEMACEALGIRPQRGGIHVRMGTHNALLRLGEQLYLEIISVDPAAPKPDQARWFCLDEMTLQSPARLTTWVARSDDIHFDRAGCGGIHGEVAMMSRGDLHWSITIPADGAMPFDGIAPTLIQWHTKDHPAGTLEDCGCRLARLRGFHPDSVGLQKLLGALHLESALSIQYHQHPHLIAEIETPNGLRMIGG